MIYMIYDILYQMSHEMLCNIVFSIVLSVKIKVLLNSSSVQAEDIISSFLQFQIYLI